MQTKTAKHKIVLPEENLVIEKNTVVIASDSFFLKYGSNFREYNSATDKNNTQRAIDPQLQELPVAPALDPKAKTETKIVSQKLSK